MNKVHAGSPCACSIGGSDSGGGAGIQADIKTFSSLGVWGLTVITAVTAQNPKKVLAYWPLPHDAVRMQIEAVVEEYDVKYFKTGMLANGGIIKTVSESLPNDARLVLDPVMISTSGATLLDKNDVSALLENLIPLAYLLTPNLNEAAYITGMDSVKTREEIEKAGQLMLDLGAKAVLVKGGHGEGNYATDILVTDSGLTEFRGRRYPFEVHGTGCCMSAAITSFLASGLKLQEACANAKKFIETAINQGFSGKSNIMSVNPSFETGNYNNKY
ncbi:phosphomethylpyrimidine kinase [Methanolacinia petrolearia DSM 11571]|uniref:Phosphomethylpyrimidine kinase n=1 Tax=Methanolacinia petrolearia (strain DSM 11571 / OCM 486 / SEBR 4847) TaxID=679926 RepID=E1RK35_METP4|nr:bifunctional hydroxymethylpyrimidine kinase/phosphomethylpyrimidine kinase [Methanolacinia petrolearia]ADN35758.1 phosphomethylpyrimidine kinase [Methanolacinia petrolearia DSM 11571]